MPGAAPNLFGFDVSGLDVEAFLAAGRDAFPFLALAWLAALLRLKRPGWLLAGAIAANVYTWGLTSYPLQRLYALGPSSDRIGNLALVQVVAAGNSPLRTPQVGQLHFEPFWGLFVAALSGWSPDRVLWLYPFLPLVPLAGFTLSLFLCLRPPGEGDGWSPWERVLAAGCATLLASAPLDFLGTYRVPWALTFLLKPNHALGLALFPLVLRVLVSARGWRGRLAAGLLLHLLGWVFVLHMVYVSFGLVVFAALSLLARHTDAKRDVLDVAVAIGVNVLVVSPYLYMLFAGYPFLDPSPRMTIAASSPHLLEPTTRAGGVFVLGLWGVVVAWRRGDRLGRVWGSQVLGGFLLWAAYLVLSALQQARERDELCYWIRFLLGASAGIGAWDLAGRAARALRWEPAAPHVRAAAVALVLLPWALPCWWNPSGMDSYFRGSLPPLPELTRRPTDHLRRETDPRAVVAGDRDFARWVAALGARRVLFSNGLHYPKDTKHRNAVEEQLVRGTDGDVVRAAAAAYGVEYLVVTPRLLALFPGVAYEDIERRAHLERVHLTTGPGAPHREETDSPRGPRGARVWSDPSAARDEFVAVFRIRPR